MPTPDLHAHTLASDGVLAPSRLVEHAALKGIDVLSVTDHDTLSGLAEAESCSGSAGVFFIPGIEISTCGEREVHILGYFVRRGMKRLEALAERLREDRARRADAFLARLRDLGIGLEPWQLEIPKGVSFSRPLLARALVNTGHAVSVAQAFDELIGVGRPAYVPRLNIPAQEAITLLASEGAVPVLAHPGLLKKPLRVPEELRAWMEAGLMGVEAFHPSHSPEVCAYWEGVARRNGLLVTGGSDFHNGFAPHGEIGQMNAAWRDHAADTFRLIGRGHKSGKRN